MFTLILKINELIPLTESNTNIKREIHQAHIRQQAHIILFYLLWFVTTAGVVQRKTKHL